MYVMKKYRSVLLVIVITMAIITWIYSNAPEPLQKPSQRKVPKVPYAELQMNNQSIPIYSRGRVSASEVRQITNEVPGLVKKLGVNLIKGAYVQKGDLLVQLDEESFRLDIAHKQADLDLAKLELVRIKAKAVVAQRGLNPNASDYARHIPQVQHANSQVIAAETALSYAKSRLLKTTIKAPIDGKVIDLSITEGEFIQATSGIAKLYGTQGVEVRLPLNDHQIDILGLNKSDAFELVEAENRPRVSLTSYQSKTDRWAGHIDRVEGERDMNQLLYVIAEVASKTLNKKSQKNLLPGSFVEAKIEGKKIKGLITLPRSAEQASNTVWVISKDNQLRRKTIEVIYRGKKDVYIKSGLSGKERVVIGDFHLMAEGLKVEPYLKLPVIMPPKKQLSAHL